VPAPMTATVLISLALTVTLILIPWWFDPIPAWRHHTRHGPRAEEPECPLFLRSPGGQQSQPDDEGDP
jgi:hypothetical protein